MLEKLNTVDLIYFKNTSHKKYFFIHVLFFMCLVGYTQEYSKQMRGTLYKIGLEHH